jgi:hypothetical protein
MAQNYSRENGARGRGADRDRLQEYGQRGRAARNEHSDTESGSGQYARDDDRSFRNFGYETESDRLQQRHGGGAYGSRMANDSRHDRERDDFSGARNSGYGRSQTWGGGYNEGGYDQHGTWGGSVRGSGYGRGQPQTRYGSDHGYADQRDNQWQGGRRDYGQQYGRNQDFDSGYQREAEGQRRRSSQHDQSYLNWRDEQIRKLDEDYEAYQRENQTKFNSDFESWRTKRTSAQEKSGKSGNNEPRSATKQ